MNAIDEVQRLQELRVGLGGIIPLLSLRDMGKMTDDSLDQLLNDVADQIHTFSSDAITEDALHDYYSDIINTIANRLTGGAHV